MGDSLPRVTRDLDLLGFVSPDPRALGEIFLEIAQIEADDALEVDRESVFADSIKEQDQYAGVRINLKFHLGTMRVPLQIDVGTGDSVYPAPVDAKFPSILGLDSSLIPAYTRESVIAEKFEAMVNLGKVNSRMKDFFDIWHLSRNHEFDSKVLADAIQGTFARRRTTLPNERPIALGRAFLQDSLKNDMWNGFVSKMVIRSNTPPFHEVGEGIWRFLEVPLTEGMGKDVSSSMWKSDLGWVRLGS